MRARDLQAAIAKWRRVMGQARVILAAADREAAERATYAVGNRVLAVLRPRSREEVQACVSIAAKHRIPIYPISRGKNYGYGSGAPTHDGAAILDLSLMKRIQVNRELATLTVEPGVTTTDAARYLTEHAPDLSASLPIHTSPLASVMGNAMDGGVGFGLYADRFSHVYSLEIVLGTGEILRTGLDRFEGGGLLGHTEARVGSSLRDLFVQSNFGVATQMTIGLYPVPNDLRVVAVRASTNRDLAAILKIADGLRHDDVFSGHFSVLNDFMRLPRLLDWRYPWSLAQGRVPLPTDLMKKIYAMSDGEFTPWRVSALLMSSDRGIGEARERHVKRALRKFDLHVLDATRERRTVGLPKGHSLPFLYWRKPNGPPKRREDIDPHRDRCGFMWCDFVMPADPSLFISVAAHLKLLIRSYGFEPALEMHTFWPRAYFLVVNLAYDRDSPGSDARAEKCDRAMTEYLSPLGALPARRRVGSMDLLHRPVDDSGSVLGRIKKVLDPEHVISPGRYQREAAPAAGEARIDDPAAVEVEREHARILESWRSTGRAAADGPLRARYLSRHQAAAITRDCRAILSALKAAQLVKNDVTGVMRGSFDGRGGYRIFDLTRSMEGFEGAVAKTEQHTWRSTFTRRDMQHARRSLAQRGANIGNNALFDSLAWLAVLSDRAHRSFLGSRAEAAVQRCVPWTRLVCECRTDLHEDEIRLVPHLRTHRERFIIRPLVPGGGSPVRGANVSRREWDAHISRAIETKGHVAQETFDMEQQVFPISRAGVLDFEGFYLESSVVIVREPIAIVTRIMETADVGASERSQVIPTFAQHV